MSKLANLRLEEFSIVRGSDLQPANPGATVQAYKCATKETDDMKIAKTAAAEKPKSLAEKVTDAVRTAIGKGVTTRVYESTYNSQSTSTETVNDGAAGAAGAEPGGEGATVIVVEAAQATEKAVPATASAPSQTQTSADDLGVLIQRSIEAGMTPVLKQIDGLSTRLAAVEKGPAGCRHRHRRLLEDLRQRRQHLQGAGHSRNVRRRPQPQHHEHRERRQRRNQLVDAHDVGGLMRYQVSGITVTGVSVTPPPPKLPSPQLRLVIPSLGVDQPISTAELFAAPADSAHLLANLRLLVQIGRSISLGSAELKTLINTTRGGLQIGSGPMFLNTVSTRSNSAYDLTFSSSPVGNVLGGRKALADASLRAVQLPGVTDAQMRAAPINAERLAALKMNIAAFMRLAGFKSLTPAVRAALKVRTFWF